VYVAIVWIALTALPQLVDRLGIAATALQYAVVALWVLLRHLVP